MKITFVLPFSGRKPVGGVKVVYEYANHLVGLGHDVWVIHPAGLYLGIGKNDRWYRNVFKYFWYGFANRFHPMGWFDLNKKVKLKWVPSLAKFFVPKANIVVATAWETAEWVASYPKDRGSKYYLIQGLEFWSGPKSRVLDTWKSPLKKIVISRWLQNFAHELGEVACYIPNGLDFNQFGLDVLPAKRNPYKVLMLYHHQSLKGTKDGLEALLKVRTEIPEIEAVLFGVTRPAKNELPDWIAFEHLPSKERLRALFNESAIFISPSWSEGWALPPAEAMQCGCATVLTDIGGHEYAIHGVTSLLSPPQDTEQMSRNILTLIKDNPLRTRLANQAVQEIAQYTWPRATKSLASYFNIGDRP